jgi:hypothetical protein
MIMWLPGSRGALVRRADAKEVMRITVESPGAITVLIHRLPVWDGLSGQNSCQGFFDLIKGGGICEKPFQRLFCPAKDSTDRCLSFERRAHLLNKRLHRIGYWTHVSRSLAFEYRLDDGKTRGPERLAFLRSTTENLFLLGPG